MKKICFYSLVFFNLINAQTAEIMGIVIDRESQSPLSGVNIVSELGGTTSNNLGEFSLLADEGIEVSFSYIGYETINTILKSNMVVLMTPMVLEGDEINVSATRAILGVTPVSFSNLSAKEIETRSLLKMFQWYFRLNQVFGLTVRVEMGLAIHIYL